MVKQSHLFRGIWVILLYWLWLPSPLLQAQPHGLEVHPVDESLLSRQPQEIVTVALRILNDTTQAGRFQPKIILPEGWQSITPPFPFELAAGESATQIISFLIPAETRAGDYPVIYEVYDQQRPSIWDNYTLQVRVLPVLGLKTTVQESPNFVVAGEPYLAKFAIRSTSNTLISVRYELHSSLKNPLSLSTDTLEFTPGTIHKVTVAVQTLDRGEPEQDVLTLTAEVMDSEISEHSTATVRVLPQVTGRETAFHTIPAQLGLSYVSNHRKAGHGAGWQAEFQGKGPLDKAGKHHIGFLLRGPATLDKADLGLRDEYWFSYWSQHFLLHVGDKYYALTPLLEPGVYGLGMNMEYRHKQLKLHAYQMQERTFDQGDAKLRETGFNVGYTFNEALRLAVNYLNKRDDTDSQIIGLWGKMRWTPALQQDLEFAQSVGSGQRGQGVRSYLQGDYGGLRFFTTFIYADPDFQGHYQDHRYGDIEFNYAATDNWEVKGYYRYRRDNLDKEPARAAPEQHEWSVGTGYRFPTNTRITVDHRQRNRQDLGFAAQFDTHYQGVRVSVSQPLAKVSLTAKGEWGKTRDRLKRTRSSTQSCRLATQWQPTEKQTYSAYVFHGNDYRLHELDDGRYDEKNISKEAIGINTGYRFGRDTSLDLNFQKKINEDDSHELYNLRFDRRFANDHQLSLIARHSTGDEQKTEGLLSYKVSLDMPVKRRQDVATLRGRVYDIETGRGIANVALNLSDRVAISDGNGYFSFPSVKLGTHYLSLERTHAASGKVPATRLPMAVKVRYGANNRVKIPMAPAASFSGKMVVHNPGNLELSGSRHSMVDNDG